MLNAEPQVGRRKILGIPLRKDDATLVRRTQAGDEQAFAAIFERHHAPLLAYCRHMLGNRDDGEDALQQAFIKAHRALLGGTTPRDLRPWLYAIARNCCLSAIAARRPTTALEDHTPALAGLSDEVRQREDLRELLDGIGRLAEDQRSALLLAELDDLSHQAIATIVGCPVSKVKALIYQARSALIADRDARETPCQVIREQLAVARGGELRRGPLRRHLNLCTGCRDFQLAVGAQRESLATLLPVAPSAGLMAAILGHGSAHVAGATGIGGAGAGASSAGGAASTSAGVTSAGTAAASGIATSGPAAVGTTAGASAGAGTSVGALVGGGLVTKLAVGGAVVALAAAGTVATPQRPTTARASRLAGVRLAVFAADRSGVSASGGSSDGSYGSTASIAVPGDGLPGTQAQESATALSDTSGPGALASVDPFTSPTSGAGAQGLLTLTDTSPSNVALTAVPRQPTVGKRAAGEGSIAQARNAQARKLRAKLRREALGRRALRLREARRRARLRKERRKALRRRHPVASKPVKAPKPPPTPVTPVSVRTRHRHALPSSTSLNTVGTSGGSQSKETTKGKRRPPTTSTGGGSITTTGTDPETSTTGTSSGKGKTSSPSGAEKASGTNGAGRSGAATGAEKSGSTSEKGKTGSSAGTEKSGSTANNKETGTGADTGTPHDGGQAGDSESATGGAGTGRTGDSSEQSNAATHKSQASGAGQTSGKGSASSAKKHLLEEEQLPNL